MCVAATGKESKMRKVDGNDLFENNRFRWDSWSADILETPDEVISRLKAYELIGRSIVDMKAIGHGYNLIRDDIEDYIYRNSKKHHDAVEALDEEERRYGDHSCIDWYAPDVQYPRSVEIDEPMILFLDDQRRFEINFTGVGDVRMSMNRLPVDLEWGTCRQNFDAGKLFSCCLNSVIRDVEVGVCFIDPMYGDERENSPTGFVNRIALVLRDYKLEFSVWVDYGVVTATDSNNNTVYMPVEEVKKLTSEWSEE